MHNMIHHCHLTFCLAAVVFLIEGIFSKNDDVKR